MSIKWFLENAAYRCLLADDNGVQYAFGSHLEHHKEEQKQPYVKKLILLLSLYYKIHILKHTPVDLWYKNQGKRIFCEDIGQNCLSGFMSLLQKSDTIIFEWKKVLYFPVLSTAEREDSYLYCRSLKCAESSVEGKTLRELPYILNTELIEWIAGNSSEKKIGILMNEADSACFQSLPGTWKEKLADVCQCTAEGSLFFSMDANGNKTELRNSLFVHAADSTAASNESVHE